MDILVVDDNPQIVRTTCDILRIKGHQASAAYSGEEGVERVRSKCPDCVLMDIKMPGLDGVEALKQMKATAPALPVILVSAYATDELMDEAKRCGAYAILSKPLNLQAVLIFMDLLCKQENILVVDDDPNFTRTLKDILTLRGYHVRTEMDPDRVLGEMAPDHPLVVILDLKLGAADGIDVLRRIRDTYPTVPVVMVTGYREEMSDSISKAFTIGAYTCLYKPFETEALLEVIEEIRLMKLHNILASA
jgi:DNA-binding NtrC family response regulator